MDDPKLRGLYGRLKGLSHSLSSTSYNCSGAIGIDYDYIVEQICINIGEDSSSFLLPKEAYYQGKKFCVIDILRSKVEQMIGYMNTKYFVNEAIIEIGALYNAINDSDLKRRCADLLTAKGFFDRAVNQATQILEDRIRARAGLQGENLVGKELVNKAINTEPAKSILLISDDQQEHEGIGHICRGIVGAFRNPTHHHLLDHYTREDALRLCGFIDQLLSLIDKAKVQKVGQQA